MGVPLDLSSLISRVHFNTSFYVNKYNINRDKEYENKIFAKSKKNYFYQIQRHARNVQN